VEYREYPLEGVGMRILDNLVFGDKRIACRIHSIKDETENKLMVMMEFNGLAEPYEGKGIPPMETAISLFGLVFKNMESIHTFEGWLKACKRRMAEHLTEGGTIGL
jgi:hypothetical protein